MGYPTLYSFLFVLCLIANVSCSLLVNREHISFPDIQLAEENYLEEPCSPLNDVWGFERNNSSFAVVGASNGVAIVNVTFGGNPTIISFPYAGCITEWRDMKVYENFLYVVNDYTSLCDCSEDQQPCQQTLRISYFDDPYISFRAVEGHAQAPLSNFPEGINGTLIYPEGNEMACETIMEDLSGKILLADRGDCSFTEKTLFAQAANASGIVIVDNYQDALYPSMSGNDTNIVIPGLLIGSSDGLRIKTFIRNSIEVTAELNQNNKEYSPLYKGPDGLYIVDLSDLSNVSVAAQTNEFFDYAHNIFIDPSGRPLAYVCGQHLLSDWGIGGIQVFDLTEPSAPMLIANFTLAYVHDIEVVVREDQSIVLYACAIYEGTLFVIDVTNPWENSDLNEFIISATQTIESPHNTAQTDDGNYLYITHEEFTYPVTVWNVTDLANIQYLDEFSVNAEQGTSPHNAMVDGDQLWMSYYSEGVLVYDISEDPAVPREIGQFDTSSYTSGFHGVWGIYPFADEDNVAYATDIESGLWVLKLIGDEVASSSPLPSPLSPPPSPSPTLTTIGNVESSEEESSGIVEDSSENSSLFVIIAVSVLAILVFLFLICLFVAGYLVYTKRSTALNGDKYDALEFDLGGDDDDIF